jgi:hypothetical protein
MLRLFILLLAGLTGLASAQTRKLTVRFLAERAPEQIGQVVLVNSGSLSDPFDLPTNRLSDPVEVSGRALLMLRVADSQPPVPAKALAKIALPEPGNAFICLLIPDPKGGYRPIVIRSDDMNFRAGDVYFYNHANKPVLGYVGTSKFILPPGEGKPLRPAGAKEETYYDVGFGVREAEGDRPLRSMRWPVLTRSRSYVFFFENPVKKRIDYRAVDEVMAPSGKVASQ